MWILAQQFGRPDPTVISPAAYILCVAVVLLPAGVWFWRAIRNHGPVSYGTPLFLGLMNLILIALAIGGPLPDEVSRLARATPLIGALVLTTVAAAIVKVRSRAAAKSSRPSS